MLTIPWPLHWEWLNQSHCGQGPESDNGVGSILRKQDVPGFKVMKLDLESGDRGLLNEFIRLHVRRQSSSMRMLQDVTHHIFRKFEMQSRIDGDMTVSRYA